MSNPTFERPAENTFGPESGLLLRARDAAATCGVSVATWWRWDAAGRCPAPVRIGSSVRWRRSELEAWVAAGCPDRLEWQAVQDVQRNRRA